MKTSSTDVQHQPPRGETTLPAATQRRDEFTRGLIEAATSRQASSPWPSAVRCIARAGRKTCGAWTNVARVEPDTIQWSCPACGQHGVLTGFEQSEHDLSSYIPTKKTRLWGLDEESRNALLAATELIPSLRAVLARASPVAEIEGFLRVDATVDELDDIYTLVEQLTDGTRSRRRRELYDDLRRSLCGAMDGF